MKPDEKLQPDQPVKDGELADEDLGDVDGGLYLGPESSPIPY